VKQDFEPIRSDLLLQVRQLSEVAHGFFSCPFCAKGLLLTDLVKRKAGYPGLLPANLTNGLKENQEIENSGLTFICYIYFAFCQLFTYLNLSLILAKKWHQNFS
jgi:hypothetical protein